MGARFQLAIGMTFAMAVAYACGGESNDERHLDPMPGAGGFGFAAVDSGGDATGGSGAFGGSSCDAGCPSYMLGGSLELSSCCGANGECGIVVDDGLSSDLALPIGCYPVDQAGPQFAVCPPLTVTNPLTKEPALLPSCCNGTCGIQMDLTPLQGPNLGCVNPAVPASQQECGSGDCQSCVATKCAVELDDCMSLPACAEIINCVAACAGPGCEDTCIEGNPEGAPMLSLLEECAETFCGALCY